MDSTFRGVPGLFGEGTLGSADFQPRRSSSQPSANQWRGSLSIKLARNPWRDQGAAIEGGCVCSIRIK